MCSSSTTPPHLTDTRLLIGNVFDASQVFMTQRLKQSSSPNAISHSIDADVMQYSLNPHGSRREDEHYIHSEVCVLK